MAFLKTNNNANFSGAFRPSIAQSSCYPSNIRSAGVPFSRLHERTKYLSQWRCSTPWNHHQKSPWTEPNTNCRSTFVVPPICPSSHDQYYQRFVTCCSETNLVPPLHPRCNVIGKVKELPPIKRCRKQPPPPPPPRKKPSVEKPKGRLVVSSKPPPLPPRVKSVQKIKRRPKKTLTRKISVKTTGKEQSSSSGSSSEVSDPSTRKILVKTTTVKEQPSSSGSSSEKNVPLTRKILVKTTTIEEQPSSSESSSEESDPLKRKILVKTTTVKEQPSSSESSSDPLKRKILVKTTTVKEQPSSSESEESVKPPQKKKLKRKTVIKKTKPVESPLSSPSSSESSSEPSSKEADSRFEKLKKDMLPVLLIFGQPILNSNRAREEYTQTYIKRFNAVSIKMDEKMKEWISLPLKAENGKPDVDLEERINLLKYPIKCSQKLDTNSTLKLNLREALELVKYAMIDSPLLPGGFIIEGFPSNLDETLAYEAYFWPFFGGLHFVAKPADGTEHNSAEVKKSISDSDILLQPPIYFRRDVELNQNEGRKIVDFFGSKCVRITNDDTWDSDDNEYINNLLELFLEVYKNHPGVVPFSNVRKRHERQKKETEKFATVRAPTLQEVKNLQNKISQTKAKDSIT